MYGRWANGICQMSCKWKCRHQICTCAGPSRSARAKKTRHTRMYTHTQLGLYRNDPVNVRNNPTKPLNISNPTTVLGYKNNPTFLRGWHSNKLLYTQNIHKTVRMKTTSLECKCKTLLLVRDHYCHYIQCTVYFVCVKIRSEANH